MAPARLSDRAQWLEKMEEERKNEREAVEAKLLEREERANKERENARLEEERVALEEFEKMKSVFSPSPGLSLSRFSF